MTLAACVDVGSTFTKVSVIDLDGAELVAAAEHPTTSGTDVLHGLDAALAATRCRPDVTYACSSAGGGLRLAVVGYEPLVSAEAGRRVALSAGARVVHVAGGRLDAAGLAALRAASPDVLLLVGGTDGGDAEVLLHNARRLGSARWRRPVVLAGNESARPEALTALDGVPVTASANVLPRIGELAPAPARAAIREVFLRHVIGGKRLSRGRRFAALVRAATPDAVLTAVSLLAGNGALLVVDIGGATTDVYSVLSPVEHDPDVAGTAWHGRTVEGDLGVRWSAPGVVAAADSGLVDAVLADAVLAGSALVDPALRAAADRLGANPALPADPAVDLALARLAAVLAVRRHARGDPWARPRDLRDASVVVGSGGVLRHAPAAGAEAVLRAVVTDGAGGWPLPRAPQLVVDRRYVLAPAGLLAADHPEVATALLRRYLLDA